MFRGPFSRMPFGRGISAGDIVAPSVGEIETEGIDPTIMVTRSVIITPDVGETAGEGVAPAVTTTISIVVSPSVGSIEAEGVLAEMIAYEGVLARAPPGEADTEGVNPAVSVTRLATIAPGVGEIEAEGLEAVLRTETKVLPGVGEAEAEGVIPAVDTSSNVIVLTPMGEVEAEGVTPSTVITRSVYTKLEPGEVEATGVLLQLTAYTPYGPFTIALQVETCGVILSVQECRIDLEVDGLAKIGNTVRLNFEVRNFAGELFTPDDPYFRVYDGGTDLIEEVNIAPSAVGIFRYDLTIPEGEGPLFLEIGGTLEDEPILERFTLPRRWV